MSCSSQFENIEAKSDLCREYIIDFLTQAERRVPPGELIKRTALETGFSRIAVKKVIKDLMDQGEIAYTYDFGSTYIELSFSKPVRITDHFILTPRPLLITTNKTYNLEIIIAPGISFGSGRHPTTKLCIEAMEQVFFKAKLLDTDHKLKALDIGTGSGVLAIAAVKAGISECLAIDNDLNAVCEAKRNVKLNMLEGSIEVTDKEVMACTQRKKFSLVCANLRFPTLKSLLPSLSGILAHNSVLILSGIRTWEAGELVDFCSDIGFKCLWCEHWKKWSGLILFYKG